MGDGPTIRPRFPKQCAALFEPHRYIVLRGGRGSMKSWSVARRLILRGWQEPIRWLCCREFQSSIRESVHQLLEGQIEEMGLSGAYCVEKLAIRGINGTEFTFAGLAEQTAESIKSYEGYDGAWVEEARVLSQRSLNMLTPTIRKAGSQILFTYNPELDTDPVHQFANSLQPHEGIVIELNWRDNPWFSGELEADRQRAQRTMRKMDYENIWEGKCLPAVSGAIYSDEMAAMQEQKRIGRFPHDPGQLVYPVFDLGWNDHMAIGMWQRRASQLVCIDYIEDNHRTLAHYSAELRRRPYNYGRVFFPHDGAKGNIQTGQTDQEVMEKLKWAVTILPQGNLAEELRVCRMAMPRMFLDSENCGRLIECLRRYRRAVPRGTGEPGDPVHDEFSHGADMVRYAALAAPQMTDEMEGPKLPPIPYPKRRLLT